MNASPENRTVAEAAIRRLLVSRNEDTRLSGGAIDGHRTGSDIVLLLIPTQRGRSGAVSRSPPDEIPGDTQNNRHSSRANQGVLDTFELPEEYLDRVPHEVAQHDPGNAPDKRRCPREESILHRGHAERCQGYGTRRPHPGNESEDEGEEDEVDRQPSDDR